MVAVPVHAAPWLEPGDRRARHALQQLVDGGLLHTSATTWPIPWADLPLETTASEHRAVERAYLVFEKERQLVEGWTAEASLGGASEPHVAAGFEESIPGEGFAAVEVEWSGRSFAAGIHAEGLWEPIEGDSLRLDGSYLAGTAGNWILGIGAVDRWWGPGWQSSLIFSSNARPIPSIWLQRKETPAFETAWLSWLGPWQLTTFAGLLESDRTVDRPKLLGARLTFRPLEGLDIGLSRILMIGGEGRPERLSTYWHAFIGRDNQQDGRDQDPGNQLAAIDLRYGRAFGAASAGVYVQMAGEDEAGAFPAKKSWLLGFDSALNLGDGAQQLYLEYVNTGAEDLTADLLPNVTYEHGIYSSGYRYRGRALGAAVDGDSDAITFGAHQFFAGGSNAGVTVSYLRLNRDASNPPEASGPWPEERQSLGQISLNYGQAFLGGWVDTDVSWRSERVRYREAEIPQLSVAGRYRYRF